jgi:hypothetical protein
MKNGKQKKREGFNALFRGHHSSNHLWWWLLTYTKLLADSRPNCSNLLEKIYLHLKTINSTDSLSAVRPFKYFITSFHIQLLNPTTVFHHR